MVLFVSLSHHREQDGQIPTDHNRQNTDKYYLLTTDKKSESTPTKYRQILITDKYRQQNGQMTIDYNRKHTDKY